MSEVAGYRLDAVHAFRVRTLRALGYATRVVLSNASQARPEWATPYRVDVSVVPPGGPPRLVATDTGDVLPGGWRLIECAPFVEGAADVELVFHLIPRALEGAARDGLVTLPREQLFHYFNVQDHFVEHHRDDGLAAGVLYQSGAFNYDLFSRERSTIIQAPKIYVSRHVDSLVSLQHGSADPRYAAVAELQCALVAADGRRTAWVERLPAFSTALLSMRERAVALDGALADAPRFYTFYGVSRTATLLPLTIQRDERSGAIGLEHSLPPMYYSDAMRGPARTRAIGGFSASPLFAQDAR